MSVFDLCVAKCEEVLSDLFVRQDARLLKSVHSLFIFHHHIPVFCDSGQVVVLDFFNGIAHIGIRVYS